MITDPMGELTLANISTLLDKQTLLINQNIKDRLQSLEKANRKIKDLEQRTLYLERKNNIVIFGLKSGNSDVVQVTINKLNELFELQLSRADINNIYKTGKSDNKPIVVEFVSFLKKSDIFKSADKLRALKGTGISVASDLCKEDRLQRKILRKHLSVARENGEDAKIVGHKLKIGDKLYTTADLESATETEYGSGSDSEDEGQPAADTLLNSEMSEGSSLTDLQRTEREKRKIQSPSPPHGVVTRKNKKSRRDLKGKDRKHSAN